MTEQELAESILSEIRKEVTDTQFKIWFSRVGIRPREDQGLEVEVASSFAKDWMGQHYSEVIERAARTVLRSPVKVCFGINPALQPEAKPEGSLPEAAAPKPPTPEPAVTPHAAAGRNPGASSVLNFQLNPTHTFANFVVGPNNSLARAAAEAVVDMPGKDYNPLFIHGGTGLGKTHLLQAICYKVLASSNQAPIHYTTCQSFITEFISAIQANSLPAFRQRFKSVAFLIIDDVDFLGVGSRERTQEEFFNTFNVLYDNRRQIVLSSDSPPHEIPKIQERLVSRFQWGLVAKLEAPAFETRCAIVKKKAEIKGRNFPPDVIEIIAENFTENIRQLEGAVNRVIAFSAVMNRPINIHSAREALSEIIAEPSPSISIDEIVSAVAEEFRIRPSDLQSKRRPNSIALPRQLCMYLCKKLTPHSLEEIGGYLGGRDHTTVLHGITKIGEMVKRDLGFARMVDRIVASLARRTCP